MEGGSRARSRHIEFRTERFEEETIVEKQEEKPSPLQFDTVKSALDKICSDCPAQYVTDKETPSMKWDKIKTGLSDLDTSKIHYVKVPENHIVTGFDILDKEGNRPFERDVEEISKWPATYTKLSKSGKGVHLHYIYTGDTKKLSRTYDDYIEVKAFMGKGSSRRKPTECNDLPIAMVSSGSPTKGEDKMVNFEAIKSEEELRTLIRRNLDKRIHLGTKPSIDFIYKILENVHSSDLSCDMTGMWNAALAFAADSTYQIEYCIKLVNKMQFKSADPSTTGKSEEARLVSYDIEIFPSMFLVDQKIEGEGKPAVHMTNPTPTEIKELM